MSHLTKRKFKPLRIQLAQCVCGHKKEDHKLRRTRIGGVSFATAIYCDWLNCHCTLYEQVELRAGVDYPVKYTKANAKLVELITDERPSDTCSYPCSFRGKVINRGVTSCWFHSPISHDEFDQMHELGNHKPQEDDQ